jgi:hypothetical protein
MFTQTQTRTETIKAAHVAEWSPVPAIRPAAAQDYVDLFVAKYASTAAICGNRLAAAMRIMCRVDGRRRGDQVGQFQVRSESNPRGWYQVDLLTRTCTCPDHPGITAKGGICKHRLAVGLQIFGPDWVITAETKRQHDIAARMAATRAADKAWAELDRLVDQYTAIGDQYTDYFAPPVEAARAAVLAATHQAEHLQKIANELQA